MTEWKTMVPISDHLKVALPHSKIIINSRQEFVQQTADCRVGGGFGEGEEVGGPGPYRLAHPPR